MKKAWKNAHIGPCSRKSEWAGILLISLCSRNARPEKDGIGSRQLPFLLADRAHKKMGRVAHYSPVLAQRAHRTYRMFIKEGGTRLGRGRVSARPGLGG